MSLLLSIYPEQPTTGPRDSTRRKRVAEQSAPLRGPEMVDGVMSTPTASSIRWASPSTWSPSPTWP